MPYGSRFVVVDDQLALAEVVSHRQRSAHPHPLALGGGDLVADTLANNLALELRERQELCLSKTQIRTY